MRYVTMVTLIIVSCFLFSCAETELSREKRMAEEGDAEAQYRMALRYHRGENEDIDQDFEKAVKWYREAANQGRPEAQVGLALCYMRGEGVGQDDQEAYIWLLVADSFMDEDDVGKEQVKTVAEQAEQLLSYEEIEEARDEAQVRHQKIVESQT